jgi:hypothetical protein
MKRAKEGFPMRKAVRVTITAAAIGIAVLSLGTPTRAGSSDIGAGLVGFGIGAILGSMMGPPEVYFVPPPPDYYAAVVYGPPNYDGPVAYGPMPRMPRAYGERAYPRQRAVPPPRAHRQAPAPSRAKTARKEAPKSDAKFKAAHAKAKRDGVHTLTQKDIEGLSVAQLKQIRGY